MALRTWVAVLGVVGAACAVDSEAGGPAVGAGGSGFTANGSGGGGSGGRMPGAGGAADAGLVALSLMLSRAHESWWPLPADWHGAVRQDAVLLQHGVGNAAAAAFLEFLRSDAARQRLEGLGYAGSTDA